MCPLTHRGASLPFPDPRPSSRIFHQMALSRLVVHAANRSITLNCQTGSEGSSPKTAYPPSCAPRGVGLKVCGQGPPSMRPDGAGVIKVAEEGSFDGSEDDDDEEDVWTSTDRWAHLGLFVLLLGTLRASGAGGSCAGVPWAAAVVFHGLLLILESSQFL
jgi:hypothetical protein